MAHTYCSSLFHCVFSTKERQAVITPELQGRLWAYMGGIARENEMKALGAGGTDNHAHLLIFCCRCHRPYRLPGRCKRSRAVRPDGCMRAAG
jgi:REP element-mobilizing transposase RayT